MTSSLVFGGFDFTTGASPRGGRFQTLSLDGWHTVTNRRERQERSQQAGAWESTGYAAALPIVASGTAVYSSDTEAATERRELLALSGARSEMTVVDAFGVGTRVVECDSLNVTPVRDRMFKWSLAVTATDPLMYGPATFGSTSLAFSGGGAGLVFPMAFPLDFGADPGVTPGVVSVPNGGTTSYHPRLRIDGPVTNPVVTMTETGDRIAYTGTVAAGQWLDIDCGRRRVLLNGLVSMRHLVSFTGAWLAVPVGGGSLVWTADTADPASTLSCWAYEGAWS